MRHRRPDPAPRHRARAPEERSLTAPEPRFVGSFPQADAALDLPLPEIALIGRSNVGKSSLLNALIGRRIAKVSGTPGKTRGMNVYVISGVWGRGDVGPDGAARSSNARRDVPRPHTPTSPSFYFLDLPGYGYAKAGKAHRVAFRRLVRHVLARPRLAAVVWLLDIRHRPSADDRAMQELLIERRTPILAAFTKCDKLPRGQRLARERALVEMTEVDADQAIATSAKTGDGVSELREAIRGLLGG